MRKDMATSRFGGSASRRGGLHSTRFLRRAPVMRVRAAAGEAPAPLRLEPRARPAHGGDADLLGVGLDAVVTGRLAPLAMRQGGRAHRIGPLVAERQRMGEAGV